MRVDRLIASLSLMVTRGRIERTRADTAPRALQATLLAGEVVDDVHLAQEYGFASRPLPGSEAVVAMIGGDRAHPVAVATLDRRHLGPELAEGDVALFSSSGDFVLLRAAGGILVKGDLEVAGQVRVGGSVEAEGDLRAAGDVEDAVGTLGALRTAYDVHTHAETQSVTGPPVPTSNGGGALALESTGGGEGSEGGAPVTVEQGTTFYDLAAGYAYRVLGTDGAWRAERKSFGAALMSTAPAQGGPRPDDIAGLEGLTYN